MPPSVNAQSADFPATYGSFCGRLSAHAEVAGRWPQFVILCDSLCRIFLGVSRGGLLPFYCCTLKLFFLYSPANCRTNLPSGRHNASTFPKSSELKSGPALAKFSPFRLTCITPTTFPSDKIGALMIF